jgi:hypothetical protein
MFKYHFKALVIKRLNYISRDIVGLVGEILIPILFMLIGFLLVSVIKILS